MHEQLQGHQHRTTEEHCEQIHRNHLVLFECSDREKQMERVGGTQRKLNPRRHISRERENESERETVNE
ncbi:hypothetical protein U1Q18_039677, partial [Sarracenia purpurea var. burkii]